ncbi:MAG TPA: hypothetical protein VJN65_05050 [Bacteroidota bacterium]|nr:hypothetical protein [Bacteroidota bacterium]
MLATNPFILSPMQEQNSEKVIQLLKPPALSYIRELSRIVNEDPEYLTFHSASVTLRVKSLLALQDAGEDWSDSDRQVMGLIKEAIIRLRSFEK